MRHSLRSPFMPLAALAVVVALTAAAVFAENINPFNDGSKYAWGENVGWLNAEPSGNGGPGVTVSATKLTGYMWGENIGWISMSCQNDGTCGTVNYGVTNDGAGHLAGYAWGENVGWISFSCTNNPSTCASTGDYAVTINPATGVFSGYAWGENIGWISFSCTNTATCGTVAYQVHTSWRGDSDGDGCTSSQEAYGAPWPNPGSTCSSPTACYSDDHWYDFYDVPLPVRADPAPNGVRNRAVNLLDVLAVLKYVPSPPPLGTLDTPNVNGLAYNADKGMDTNGDTVAEIPPDGVPDGRAYDRSISPAPNPPWDAGPPNGVISLANDVIPALKQYGLDCSKP